jgi:osmotically-inducible protein OsmY
MNAKTLKSLILASGLTGLSGIPLTTLADSSASYEQGGPAAESGFRTDGALAARVRAAIAGNPNLHALPIRVAAIDGVIRLSGTVPNGVQVDIAEDVASRVAGVKEVNNLLNPQEDS